MTGKTLLKEQETIYRESEYVHSVRAKGALSNSEGGDIRRWLSAMPDGTGSSRDRLWCLLYASHETKLNSAPPVWGPRTELTG
jgi:hypothetical protein